MHNAQVYTVKKLKIKTIHQSVAYKIISNFIIPFSYNYGNHITINGRFYNLRQLPYRNVQKHGLSTIYKQNVDFQKYCSINSLASLLMDKKCWKELCV